MCLVPAFYFFMNLLRDQRGRFGHTEPLIVLALGGIAASVLISNLHSLGFWKALLRTTIVMGSIMGALVALILAVWFFGWMRRCFEKKDVK